MKQNWWKNSVVYQIYPRSFCDSNGDGVGDLNGIRSKLDYLEELGVNVIWMSPVYKSPNDDNGYDIADYQAIMDEFGTMADFDALLAEAHERGLKVVMDLVVNHTSDEHGWFVESRSARDNDKRDFYIWREGKDGAPPTNWGSWFSGSAWEWDETTRMYYLHCFSKKQPDLNWANPRVRDAVFDMMTWWCEKGVDGFRMDVISMISKPEEPWTDSDTLGGLYGNPYLICNGPHVHEYLREMRQRVLSRYDLMTVGETAKVTIEEAKKYANADGSELNMVFQFEHVELDSGPSDKWCTDPVSLPALKANLAKWQNALEGVAWNSLFFCNHDQPRVVSRWGDGSPQAAKCLATALHLMQGTPYVYQGEELGMTNCPFGPIENYRDIESINAFRELTGAGLRQPDELLKCIAYKSRDNARTPMQWNDGPNAGFTTGVPWIMVNPNYTEINAAAQRDDPDSVLSYYKRLIRLRREENPWRDAVTDNGFVLLCPEDEHVFAYARPGKETTLLVACNLSPRPRRFCPPAEFRPGSGSAAVPVLCSEGEAPALTAALELSPWQAAVWAVSAENIR